ncbi:MAG: class I SAM-dependent methyltransferase [Spirochaetia bacterium]|nr:class I SAM-dependent methyltransferase [Spirochaetia bacterium]
MAIKSHEELEYQEFLVSDIRENLVSAEIYQQFISNPKPNINVLDFGCGLGYVMLYYAENFKNIENIHVYGCDYQEELLDLCWKKIVQKKLNNVTPFFMPEKSLVNFPQWVPKMDHIFLSFCLSTVHNKEEFLISIANQLNTEGIIHIIDWKKNTDNENLKILYPTNNRFELENMKTVLSKINFRIIKLNINSDFYYVIDTKPEN